ncbi:MAG: GNAT family N-acetyltransferase [Planctomycetaceae bacterium]|nr:GNAT family N-acetyltransferase [Planctomycetaceae bacterium]
MKPIILECTTREQCHEIGVLARQIWTEHYAPITGLPQVEYMLDKFQSPEAIARQIHDEGYRYFAAFLDGKMVGYCAVQKDAAASIFLSKFYMSRDVRGQGIGKQLLHHAISACRPPCQPSGSVTVWLTVNKRNETSIAVYRKLGFRITNELVTDIGNGYVMDDYRLEMTYNAG